MALAQTMRSASARPAPSMLLLRRNALRRMGSISSTTTTMPTTTSTQNEEAAQASATATATSGKAMPKRFWKEVRVGTRGSTALTVELDGRPVKTPNGNLLLIPRSSATLAHLVAAEWHAQERRLKPHALVLTSLVVRAIDDFGMDVGADASASTSTSAGSNAASTTSSNATSTTSSNATSTSEKDQVVAPSLDAAAIVRNAAAASSRASAITFLMRYLDTDTILYHSTRPDNLVALQHQHWQPLLHWVREEFGVELKTTEGILGVRQTEEVKRVLTEVVEKMDALTLAGFERAVMHTKSFIIGLALTLRHLDVESAVQAARVETMAQTARWGEVEDTHDVEVEELRRQCASTVLHRLP